MTAPHETPVPGPAARFADALAAHLPVIDTPRLRLRAPRLADLPAWHAILTTDRAVHLEGPYDRDESFAEFAASLGGWLLRGHGPWAVETRDAAVIGFVLIGFEPGDREPELGFLFTAEGEGRGLAFEAAAAARGWARDTLNLPALVSYIAPENARSRALALRLGARRDGMVDGCEVWRHLPETETAHG